MGRLEAGEFAVYPELNLLAEIMAGQDEAINSIAERYHVICLYNTESYYAGFAHEFFLNPRVLFF